MKVSNSVGLAIVGIKGIGKRHAKNILRVSNAKLNGCYDIDSLAGKDFAQRFNCHPFDTYEQLLDNPTIDGVILATPNELHCEEVCLAAEKGKHVFVEKPIALTIEDADMMIRTCEENSVLLQVGHHQRKDGGLRKLKELIEKGKIGEVTMMEANQFSAGGLRLTPSKWRWYEDKCPGGPFLQLGIHQIDNLIYLMGKIKRVNGLFKKLRIDAQIDDTTQVLLDFNCGAVGYIGSSYVTAKRRSINVYGDKGALIYEYEEGIIRRMSLDGSWEGVDFEKKDGRLEEIIEFVECIKKGRNPEVSGREGKEALLVALAAFYSARKGLWVKLDDFSNCLIKNPGILGG